MQEKTNAAVNPAELPEMTTLVQLLSELKKRDLLKKDVKPVNPIEFAIEQSLKKRVQRNMYKC